MSYLALTEEITLDFFKDKIATIRNAFDNFNFANALAGLDALGDLLKWGAGLFQQPSGPIVGASNLDGCSDNELCDKLENSITLQDGAVGMNPMVLAILKTLIKRLIDRTCPC